jgi:chorismate dehydratase
MFRPVVSAISFLNTAPLVWDFEHRDEGHAFELTYTVPSACAEALRTGVADIGIIPAVAYHSIPGLQIIPEVCVGASGTVRSILLISKVPIEQIRTVAADTSSRSSVALLRVIFRAWYGGARQFTAMEPFLPLMLDQHDAALIIGDPALSVDRDRYITYDLGEMWFHHTGKPFVFAFWAVRDAALEKIPRDMDLARIFRDSRDHGLEHLDDISRQWSNRVALSPSDIRSYLTFNVDYTLSPEHLDGMRLFLELAIKHGVIAETRPLRFLGQEKHTQPIAAANGLI